MKQSVPFTMYYFMLVAAGVVVVGVSVKVISNVRAFLRKKKRINWSLKKRDVILLHQLPRGYNTPSTSNYPLKLETYLRMAKLPYENDFADFIGPKLKLPYITLNGIDIGDSQFIIEHLNRKYSINLNEGLSVEDEALGHALRILVENSLYWSCVMYGFIFDKDNTITKVGAWPLSARIIFPLLRKSMKKQAWYQGTGRHTEVEIMGMAQKDIAALSTLLGKKKYFLGDKPREVDCALFGLLAQIVWNFPNSELGIEFSGEFSNLKAFCLRMKEEFWPDWENCLSRR